MSEPADDLALRELEEEIERLRAAIIDAATQVLREDVPRDVVALNLRRSVADERKGYRWGKEEILERIHEWTEVFGEPPTSSKWGPGHLRNKGQEDDLVNFLSGHYPTTRTVARFFGSFPAAIQAAGYAPAKIGRPDGSHTPGLDPRWPEWEGWQYLSGYRQRSGMSMKELAAKTHISYGHLRHMEQGVKTNPGIRVVLAVSVGLGVRPSVLLDT
jgi:hypothetical protein